MRKSSIFSLIEQHNHLLSGHDIALLSYIDTIAPSDESQRNHFFTEILNGAYVFIPDNGDSYHSFRQLETELINRDYSSSHVSIDTQYAVRSQVLGECLFGTREMDSNKGSWIQLEAYHTSLTHLPAHLYTYAVYVVTGENSGPMGNSSFTESKPLVVPPPQIEAMQNDIGELSICSLDPEATPITLGEVFTDLHVISSMETTLANEMLHPAILTVLPELTTITTMQVECLA
ncbi:MAG: hypothetical protein AB7I18_11435 [Candidatus Berkiella sp.]